MCVTQTEFGRERVEQGPCDAEIKTSRLDVTRTESGRERVQQGPCDAEIETSRLGVTQTESGRERVEQGPCDAEIKTSRLGVTLLTRDGVKQRRGESHTMQGRHRLRQLSLAERESPAGTM
ncbi:hypothetical protein L798_00787 [Zootermopsis nevadensis]|uniref:Uncharacterized protein n=1 Tax=Zootermopsis nevadensis TaxID=136037 RepID=A0A067QN07_ZOONE|nr:hypothetical protein L798_00787 [Zootermopsis nevadensis]